MQLLFHVFGVLVQFRVLVLANFKTGAGSLTRYYQSNVEETHVAPKQLARTAKVSVTDADAMIDKTALFF